MTTAEPAYDRLLDALGQHGSRVRANGTSAVAQCPAHDDRNPSLSVRRIEGSVLVHCHAGCVTDEVLAALDLTPRDLYDNRVGVDYRYDDGRVVHRKWNKSSFPQSGNKNGTPQLYRLSKVEEAVAARVPVFVVEGEKDVHAIEAVGGVATCNPMGAGKWGQVDPSPLYGANVTVVADKDGPGRAHADQVAASLHGKAATLQVVEALEGKDAADHIAAGHGLDDFIDVTTTSGAPRTLTEVRAAFTRWLGAEYDLTVLDVVLAVAASEQLTGDPAWLLVVSGPGAAKTETVIPLAGAGATVTSVISGEAALLSGTARRERAKNATGGLLRKLGSRGVLVVKDVTSILSMNRDARAQVLAALREVYDGMWERNLGTDGGQTLRWTGRLVLIGAVTTAWDQAHAVVSTMGDRFLLVRLDSTTGRLGAGRQAIRNTGTETLMRAELAEAIGGLLGTVDPAVDPQLTEDEEEELLRLADVVTLARTGVERDFKGDVLDAHAPEMPTRFAKQLAQVVRGALSLGMGRPRALELARRCSADSVPPLRLMILTYLAEHPDSTTHEVRTQIDKPRTTVGRELEALHMLGLVTVDELEESHGDGTRTVWRYSLAGQTDAETIRRLGGTGKVIPYPQDTEKERRQDGDAASEYLCSDIPGTTPDRACSVCGDPLDPVLATFGETTHPTCVPEENRP